MNEVPLFVPYGPEHLAAVLCLPESEPRGLVVLLQEFAVGRSHKNRMWTRAARSMAALGIASVRMDYLGTGDSTGEVPAVEFESVAIEEVVAVAELAADLVGTKELGVVGNCFGARAAVAFAAGTPACRTAALVVPGSLDAVLAPAPQTSRMGRAAKSVARRSSLVKRVVRPILKRGRGREPRPFVPEVAEAHGGTDLLFVVPDDGKHEGKLRAAAAGMPEGGGRVEFELISASRITGTNFPVTAQPVLIDILTTWMDRTLPGASLRVGQLAQQP